MDQQQLTDRLEARVADVPVGAPPVDAMRAAVRRRRRGRAAVLASVAAVAVIATGGVVWQIAGTEPDPQPPVASDPPPSDPDAPPAGHRYVGIGAAAVAVPDSWGTNDTECGTPQADTVVIDVGVTCLALIPRPLDVESIEISSSPMPEDAKRLWTPFEIDGEPALLSPTLSISDSAGGASDGFGEAEASASVYLPEQGVLFRAASSSPSPEAVVADLLAGITILEEHVAVPGFNDLAYDADSAPAIGPYTERLQALGLTVELTEKASPLNLGDVLETEPAVGTVVAPGDTVRVTFAR